MSTKSIPISKTKIVVPPRRPELLSRPRLLKSLKESLDNKLLLISAPAGYGKTSLLIDLADDLEMPVCWLSLDPLDRDPQRFIAYLIASLAEHFRDVGETSRLQLNQLKSIEDDAEAILVMLTNELYEHAENDFLLIIDDFHLLDDAPIISSLLNRFLQLVDENCHIMLASRTLPALDDVTLMVAREQVAGLSHTELAFVPREVQALYSQNYHQHISDETAAQFVEQTGGWITGMVLSNLPGVGRVSAVDAFAYLGHQVLDQQPDEIRRFLLRTSLPEEFNAEVCEIILGPPQPGQHNWATLMGLILEKNLFVLPLGADGRWLRYHPLFREFLQSRLRVELPHEVQSILERMVVAYEQAGEWEKAYFTCSQSNDIEALAGLIERAGKFMLRNAVVTLEGWINSLPPSIARTRPGLISLRGPILAIKGKLPESRELLDKAVSTYRKQSDPFGLLITLIRRANTLRFLGDYKASLEDVEEALGLAESNSAFQSSYAEGFRLKGLDLYRLGESSRAVESLEQSLALYSSLKETDIIPTILMETGMVHGAMGDVNSALRSYHEALKLRQAERNLYLQAEILNNLAVLYHQLGDYELASETFENGLTCARKSRNVRAESLILTGLGDLYSEIEELDAALQLYQQAEAITNALTGSFVLNYLVVAKGFLSLLKGDLNSAAQALHAYKRKIRVSQSTYERGLWLLFEGRYQLMMGEPKKAIRLLQECRDFFVLDGRILEKHWSMIWLSASYEQSGQRAAARTELTEFLSDVGTLDHALLVTFRQASEWLNDLQGDAEIGHEISALFERTRQLTDKLPSTRRMLRRHAQSIQMPSAGLIIRALGRPEVIVNGRLALMPDWKTQSVRDLFFHFLYRQDRVTKEKIGVALWPETEDPQMLKARFKNEIYRLRRVVGRNAIIFDEEYYCFNRALDYEYDVEAFDAHLARAHKSRDIHERIQYFQKAVDLVRGPYLSDVDAAWADVERERLGQSHLTALDELAHLYLDTNQLRQCLSICRQVLERDRCNETMYQLEMRAYAALGDRAAVARRYQACKIALQEELELDPSGETEQIYQELTK